MIRALLNWLTGNPPVQELRAPQWSRVRDEWVKDHPFCAVCGTKENIEVHHCTPVFVDKTRELDRSNLITLCRRDHFIFGHLSDWHSWNRTVREDVAVWHDKIAGRP